MSGAHTSVNGRSENHPSMESLFTNNCSDESDMPGTSGYPRPPHYPFVGTTPKTLKATHRRRNSRAARPEEIHIGGGGPKGSAGIVETSGSAPLELRGRFGLQNERVELRGNVSGGVERISKEQTIASRRSHTKGPTNKGNNLRHFGSALAQISTLAGWHEFYTL